MRLSTKTELLQLLLLLFTNLCMIAATARIPLIAHSRGHYFRETGINEIEDSAWGKERKCAGYVHRLLAEDAKRVSFNATVVASPEYSYRESTGGPMDSHRESTGAGLYRRGRMRMHPDTKA